MTSGSFSKLSLALCRLRCWLSLFGVDSCAEVQRKPQAISLCSARGPAASRSSCRLPNPVRQKYIEFDHLAVLADWLSRSPNVRLATEADWTAVGLDEDILMPTALR